MKYMVLIMKLLLEFGNNLTFYLCQKFQKLILIVHQGKIYPKFLIYLTKILMKLFYIELKYKQLKILMNC